jgi:hypothetical protein
VGAIAREWARSPALRPPNAILKHINVSLTEQAQPVPQPRPRTPITPRLKFPTRIRPPLVNPAGHALAHAPGQGCAARWAAVGAAQAAGVVHHFLALQGCLSGPRRGSRIHSDDKNFII